MNFYHNNKLVWKNKVNTLIIINIFLNVIKQIRVKNNEIELKTNKKNLLVILKILNQLSVLKYVQLTDILCFELLGSSKKNIIYYLLLSNIYQSRLLISLQIDSLTSLKTVTTLYFNAEWLECEVWDLFGIYFRNNANLRRILTDYGFSHHPLKKNFPLTGHYELNYSFNSKLIKVKKVVLVQELRNLLSENIWDFTILNEKKNNNQLILNVNFQDILNQIIYLKSNLFQVNNQYFKSNWFVLLTIVYQILINLWLKYINLIQISSINNHNSPC